MYAVSTPTIPRFLPWTRFGRWRWRVRAADLGGFAAAAKHLSITPSAVSRGIAELERTLRISIFKRSTRHIQLTEEGRELYHRARDVLERLAAIEVTANAVDKQVRGTIHVGIMPPLSRHVVMPLHADITVRCRKIGFDNLNPIIWLKIANAQFEVENGSKFLGKPYEPNAIIKNDIEFILMQRKPGGYRKPTVKS